LARDSFVTQFYQRGLRIGDVLSLKPSDIDGDRIVFSEGKTGSLRSIPIHAKVQAIIDRWKGQSDYLLPILKFKYDKNKTENENKLIYKKAVESATSWINKNLDKLAKKVGIDKKI